MIYLFIALIINKFKCRLILWLYQLKKDQEVAKKGENINIDSKKLILPLVRSAKNKPYRIKPAFIAETIKEKSLLISRKQKKTKKIKRANN